MSKKLHQGFYTPINPEKYIGDVNQIVFRSGWERKFMVRCDTDPSFLKWSSEVPIPYISSIDGKKHRYFVDFIVQIKTKDENIKNLMIEIKPNKERFPPEPPKRKTDKTRARYMKEVLTYQRNQDKWKFAESYAEKRGMKFMVMDEYSLGIKKRT